MICKKDHAFYIYFDGGATVDADRRRPSVPGAVYLHTKNRKTDLQKIHTTPTVPVATSTSTPTSTPREGETIAPVADKQKPVNSPATHSASPEHPRQTADDGGSSSLVLVVVLGALLLAQSCWQARSQLRAAAKYIYSCWPPQFLIDHYEQGRVCDERREEWQQAEEDLGLPHERCLPRRPRRGGDASNKPPDAGTGRDHSGGDGGAVPPQLPSAHQEREPRPSDEEVQLAHDLAYQEHLLRERAGRSTGGLPAATPSERPTAVPSSPLDLRVQAP